MLKGDSGYVVKSCDKDSERWVETCTRSQFTESSIIYTLLIILLLQSVFIVEFVHRTQID